MRMLARVALVGLALGLTGCVAAPPTITETELAAHNAQLLAKTWQRTGLAGDAPTVTAVLIDNDEDWSQALFECLQGGTAADNSGMEFNSSDGYGLMPSPGSTADPDEAQRDFYVCVARYPRPYDPRDLISAAQLDYIYDYFADSLVPCMLDHGYVIEVAPTRVEFHDLAGGWHPYGTLPAVIGGRALTDVRELCGAEYPDLG